MAFPILPAGRFWSSHSGLYIRDKYQSGFLFRHEKGAELPEEIQKSGDRLAEQVNTAKLHRLDFHAFLPKSVLFGKNNLRVKLPKKTDRYT